MHRRLALFAFALTLSPAGHAQFQNVEAHRLSEHVKTLASDEFEGRGPASPGERKTIDYVIDHFVAAGLQPAGEIVDGKRTWTQPVPLLKTELAGPPHLELELSDGAKRLTQGMEMVVRSPLTGASGVRLEKAPLVFVGYGVTAPERNWDDFKGEDLSGKVMVVLVNDPDFEGGEGEFGGKAMTYYGRWTYKFEEAARRGAAGVLVIHESEPASYGWNTVRNSNSGVQFDIVRADPSKANSGVEGWIQRDLAEQLFEASGLSFEEAKSLSRTRAFKPIKLNAQLSVSLAVRAEIIRSHNVVGYKPGDKYPDETVIYTAHWDHLGVGQPDSSGDRIYNGASDNATGVAQLLEQARVFGQGPPTDRSLVFLSTTAEEVGLLGAEYYASNPLFPIGRTVAVIDSDGGQLWGKSRNFSIQGNVKVGLLDLLIEEGRQLGRSYSPDPHPEYGNFFRSDPFAMAKAGIPALGFEGGRDLIDGGTARGEGLASDYIEHRYHQPGDEWSPAYDFSGMAEDGQLLFNLGQRLANSRLWPEWSQDSEFKRVRDQTAHDRTEGRK